VAHSLHKTRLRYAAEFICAARGYWLGVFPSVVGEARRWRARAARIPDLQLRQLALLALERKGANLEGAAAFATLAPPAQRRLVAEALVRCQAMCDYLDVLCEQPAGDPVANGRALHEALLDAVAAPGRRGGDYYRHHLHDRDGGYLRALALSVRSALAPLPGRLAVSDSMTRVARRIRDYQSLNHGDAHGSYRQFARWAAREGRSCPQLRWWEAGGGAGSTLNLHVLIGAAADASTRPSDAQAIDEAYFPWIGALHSLLDSLVDRGEDLAMGTRGLIDCYPSSAEAAERTRTIAAEALARARVLPRGRRHALIVAAMASFYVCDLPRSGGQLSAAVVPGVLEELGALAAPNMAVLRARRLVASSGARDGSAALRSAALAPAPERRELPALTGLAPGAGSERGPGAPVA
jgi:tetraprenyl-beta-curcumene synthase